MKNTAFKKRNCKRKEMTFVQCFHTFYSLKFKQVVFKF